MQWGKIFSTKTELLNLRLTLRFAQLDMIDARLGSNGLTFSGVILADTQLVTFLLLAILVNQGFGHKLNKFGNHHSP